MKKSLKYMVAALVAMSAWNTAQAETFPENPVRIIVPYPPGQSADVVARLIADKIREQTNLTFIVENKPGANATIGATYVANAEPDGYTILMAGTTPLAAAGALNASLPYDPVESFDAISGAVLNTYMIVVKADNPANNVQEFIDQVKAAPSPISYGSGNQSTRMAAELFQLMTGTKMNYVPYPGTDRAITDLMNGQVGVMFNGTQTSMPHIKGGTLKSLGISTTERDPLLPDLPTIGETIDGYSYVASQGIVAPKGTPPERIARLHQLIADALNDPAVTERLQATGVVMWPVSPEDFAEQIATESELWKRIVEEADIPVNP